jgi:hypothetical protein
MLNRHRQPWPLKLRSINRRRNTEIIEVSRKYSTHQNSTEKGAERTDDAQRKPLRSRRPGIGTLYCQYKITRLFSCGSDIGLEFLADHRSCLLDRTS